jgi:rhamnosyltransferase
MIDILLATYNGERYLEAQINSLLTQSEENWTLYIRDDGSIDDTVSIINKYIKIDKRIVFIDDNLKNLGVASNFLHLLNFSKSDYTIFCDQDDIWLENKLVEFLRKFKEVDNSIPYAIYSNAYLYKSDISTIEGKVTLSYPNNLNSFLFLNAGIQGCSIMFNKKLREICLNTPDYITMHDHFVCLAAITFGKFQYLEKNLMLYRQHANNVTDNSKSSIFQKIVSFFSNQRTVIEITHYKAVISFYKKFNHLLSKNQDQIFKAYIRFPYSTFIMRLIIIIKYRFIIFNNRFVLIIKTFLRKPI